MHPHTLNPLIAAGLLLALLHVQTAAAGMYIWVDKDGRKHYSDTMPPHFQKAPDELDKSGRVKVRADGDQRPVEDADTLARKRRDKALLSSYVSAREIDLARDRALELQQLVVDGIQARLKVQTEKLARLNASAAERRRAGQPPAPGIAAQQEETQKQIAGLTASLQQNQEKLEHTRARFAADRQRFLELKGETE